MTISQKYDEQRKKFIPCFDDFYGVSVSVASVDTENPNILDIGAGTGLLSAFSDGKISRGLIYSY